MLMRFRNEEENLGGKTHSLRDELLRMNCVLIDKRGLGMDAYCRIQIRDKKCHYVNETEDKFALLS